MQKSAIVFPPSIQFSKIWSVLTKKQNGLIITCTSPNGKGKQGELVVHPIKKPSPSKTALILILSSYPGQKAPPMPDGNRISPHCAPKKHCTRQRCKRVPCPAPVFPMPDGWSALLQCPVCGMQAAHQCRSATFPLHPHCKPQSPPFHPRQRRPPPAHPAPFCPHTGHCSTEANTNPQNQLAAAFSCHTHREALSAHLHPAKNRCS